MGEWHGWADGELGGARVACCALDRQRTTATTANSQRLEILIAIFCPVPKGPTTTGTITAREGRALT